MSRPSTTLPANPDVEIESVRTVYEGRFALQLVDFRYRRFDGQQSKTMTWELWRRGRAGALLPYDPDTDQVVLIEQFRLPALAAGLPPVLVEVPAGLCDGTEDAETTMRREVREETGLDADLLAPIGDFILAPGGCDERIGLFVGRVRIPETGPDGVLGLAGLAHEGEDIRVITRPAEQAIAEALAGRYPNSVATICLLWLGMKRAELRKEWAR